jgi:antitoxin component YwqK of YwqJK toxin-antitoxin module
MILITFYGDELVMRKKTMLLIGLLVIFVPHFVLADVTRKTKQNPDGTQERIFYSEAKEVAREFVDQDGVTTRIVGTIPDGLVKESFMDGAIREEAHYKNGKKDGVTKLYNKKGVLRGEFNFKNGKQEGLSKTYHSTGELFKEIMFKNGKLEGINKEYTKDGKILFEANFKDDKPDGKTTRYHPDGGKTIAIYDRGQLVSEKHYDVDERPTD